MDTQELALELLRAASCPNSGKYYELMEKAADMNFVAFLIKQQAKDIAELKDAYAEERAEVERLKGVCDDLRARNLAVAGVRLG